MKFNAKIRKIVKVHIVYGHRVLWCKQYIFVTWNDDMLHADLQGCVPYWSKCLCSSGRYVRCVLYGRLSGDRADQQNTSTSSLLFRLAMCFRIRPGLCCFWNGTKTCWRISIHVNSICEQNSCPMTNPPPLVLSTPLETVIPIKI